jgi:hypothetical protein
VGLGGVVGEESLGEGGRAAVMWNGDLVERRREREPFATRSWQVRVMER